jgi:hypothetical protein
MIIGKDIKISDAGFGIWDLIVFFDMGKSPLFHIMPVNRFTGQR